MGRRVRQKDAGVLRDGPSRDRVITGHQDHPDSRRVAARERRGHLVAQGIGEAEEAVQLEISLQSGFRRAHLFRLQPTRRDRDDAQPLRRQPAHRLVPRDEGLGRRTSVRTTSQAPLIAKRRDSLPASTPAARLRCTSKAMWRTTSRDKTIGLPPIFRSASAAATSSGSPVSTPAC
jgi:hypothetical protein